MTTLTRLAALAAALVLASAASAQSWPFGDGPRGGDFWNLGPLGAKALTGVATAPTADAGGRVSVSGDVPFLDGGPEELVLAAVAPDGPAGRAGLAPGDRIVGVGGKRFKEDESLEALATALSRARSKGVIDLLVERGGSRERLEVTLDAVGTTKDAPTKLEARTAAAGAARAFLAQSQAQDGSLRAGLSGDVGKVVNTSLAGLAWLCGGSDLEQGEHRDNLVRATDWVVAWLEAREGQALPTPPAGQPNWDQSNWAIVYAGIYLGELHARSPTDRVADALAFVASELVRRQEPTGGYAHGPGGPNALSYVELNMVGSLALMAFGAAHRNGVSVDRDAVKKLIEYLEKSSSGGGVGYSTGEGQQGMGNIGRSAPTWRGLVLVGENKGFAKSTRSYTKSKATEFREGHASLMQHIFFGGLGAHALSSKDGAAWFDDLERELVLAQAHDGSFQPRPFQETANLGSNSDVTMGQEWTTASWAILLALDGPGGGLPLIVGAQ